MYSCLIIGTSQDKSNQVFRKSSRVAFRRLSEQPVLPRCSECQWEHSGIKWFFFFFWRCLYRCFHDVSLIVGTLHEQHTPQIPASQQIQSPPNTAAPPHNPLIRMAPLILIILWAKKTIANFQQWRRFLLETFLPRTTYYISQARSLFS